MKKFILDEFPEATMAIVSRQLRKITEEIVCAHLINQAEAMLVGWIAADNEGKAYFISPNGDGKPELPKGVYITDLKQLGIRIKKTT